MFTGRSRDTIRDEILAYLRAEYAAASPARTLLTSRGSPDWINASALAVMLEGLEAQAEQNTRDILPDQASDEALARHGYVYGVDRRTGVAAQLTVTVTGTPSATITIAAGTTMTWTDGTLYLVTSSSVTLSGGGSGTINVSATTTGASTTRTVADVLTFSSAPSGLNATGAVASVVTTGADQETTQAWAQRIVDRLRFRPGAGNDADWREWVFQYVALDIREVWVYPRVQPPTSYPGLGTIGVLGCVTVLAAGPPQGDSPTNTRMLGTSGAALTAVKEYINGTRNALGLPVSNGEQLRPVTMSPADVSIEAITTQNQAVVATVTMNSANAFSFNFTATINAATTQASLVLDGNFTAGSTDLEDEAVLVNVGTGTYRGGYYRVVLPAGTYDGGAGTTTFAISPVLPAAPTGTLYPAPANWSAIRTAVFGFFDVLGPGDTSPAIRFPTEDYSSRATLYKQALASAIMAVPGVLTATITTPATDTTPPRKTVLDLTTLLVTQ
jgi:hypothetical protein